MRIKSLFYKKKGKTKKLDEVNEKTEFRYRNIWQICMNPYF